MKRYFLSLLAGVSAIAALAVPAKRGVVNLEQPDGSQIEVLIIGDEYRHMYLTPDSLPLTAGADGMLEYARFNRDAGRLEPTGVRPSAVRSRRSPAENAAISRMDARATITDAMNAAAAPGSRAAIAQSGLGRFDDAFPVEGDVKALVILVEYSDTKFSTPNAAEYFSNMLMQEGFSAYNGTGSVRDYFVENSNGIFRPEFDCYGPVTLPQKRSYYGGNNYNGDDKAPEDMIIHAVKILDPEVDFSQYDTDGDGFVDNVYVFYAGRGEADGGAEDTVWPHSFNIYYGAGKSCFADGVRFDYYACSNEWDGSKPTGIGTFTHEFSHVMGLPDLYSTNYGSAENVTPGEYDILDMGSYNNDGRTPPAYSAFERNALRWIEPQVLSGPATVTLGHIAETNEACLIPTEKSNEFFLLENRQKSGWDKNIPYHGMLIWHIDYNASVWRSNSVNNTASHQYVDLVEACGTANNASSLTMRGYPFPGSKKITSFTSTTTPALKSWAKQAIDLPITNIKEANGLITFDVAGGQINGIDDIDADISDSAAEYYTVDGLRVAAPTAPGMYIRRCGGEVTKIHVR